MRNLRLVLAGLVIALAMALIGTGIHPRAGGAACFAAEGDEGEPSMPGVGSVAPDFTLKDLRGKKVHLKDVLEHKAVLLAFFATWHPRSRDQIAALKPLADEFKEMPLQVMAVALDRGGKDVVEPFAHEQALNFTVLLDPDLTTKGKYQIKATLPLAFVIGQNGEIRAAESSLDPEPLERLRSAARAEAERIQSATGAQGTP